MNTKSYSGYFITLEGSEGAGKSSNVEFINSLLKKSDKQVVLTREPGGTQLGEQIREVLLQKNSFHISDATELILMFAARAQHIQEIIKPALEAGNIVLCDRFTDSSYAYQGGGRSLGSDQIDKLVNIVHPDLTPDLTLLFDVSVETGLKRAARDKKADRFESEQIEFFNRVRQTYLEIAAAEPGRVRIIDAEKDMNSVRDQIRTILEKEQLC